MKKRNEKEISNQLIEGLKKIRAEYCDVRIFYALPSDGYDQILVNFQGSSAILSNQEFNKRVSNLMHSLFLEYGDDAPLFTFNEKYFSLPEEYKEVNLSPYAFREEDFSYLDKDHSEVEANDDLQFVSEKNQSLGLNIFLVFKKQSWGKITAEKTRINKKNLTTNSLDSTCYCTMA